MRVSKPLSFKNGSPRSNPRSVAISVSERVPASSVVIRPARLSRPASIRNAELPVTNTCTVDESTNDFNWGAQFSKFWTSSSNRNADPSRRAASLQVLPSIVRSNQSTIRKIGESKSAISRKSSN